MDREAIFRATIDNYLNPVIGKYREDPAVTEILINGHDEIYVERNGRVELSEAAFEDAEVLLAIAHNLAQYTNKRITENTARFDSRLPDGSRIHVVMPRVSRKGLCISIRKFSQSAFSLEGLVESGSLSARAKEYLEILVELGKNVIVSGGTGSGKTSFLNALSGKIPATDRIIVIEDTSELQLQQPHVLSFETAAPDRHGHGSVSIRDLFHSALRMRPDRIVIGECRGAEALDLIQAMISGHGGSMSTLHAKNSSDALNRLETMALMADIGLPLAALRVQIASAIDVVIQLSRVADGSRVVVEIAEVEGLGSDGRFVLNTLFTRVSDEGKAAANRSRLDYTEKRSVFANHLMKQSGARIQLTREIFGRG
jgi:pilus assembly protein CpaF